MQLVVLGVNHKTAPVEIREKVSFSREDVTKGLNLLYEYEDIAEGVILSTCNRTEIFAVLETKHGGKDVLLDLLGKLCHVSKLDDKVFYYYEGAHAIKHIFTVASGMDSLVVGEGQILSQVKQAYVQAHGLGVTGTILNIVFQKAIAIGKKVRTHTGLSGKTISVAAMAVNLAENCLKDIEKAKVLILGAGKMSELTATHLRGKGIHSIFVSNRTFEKAKILAEKFDGKAVHFAEYMVQAETADILITSTGAPHYLIEYDKVVQLMHKRKGKPIVMIDIAVPRDIDPRVGSIEGVNLFNIDTLESVVEQNKQYRLQEASKARPLVDEAVEEIEEKLSYLSIRPLMFLISEKAERIRKREVHRIMAKLPDATERERRLIEGMSRMLVRKLLRDPMIRFNEVAGQEEESYYDDLIHKLFKLTPSSQEQLETKEGWQ